MCGAVDFNLDVGVGGKGILEAFLLSESPKVVTVSTMPELLFVAGNYDIEIAAIH
tara:strand:- start:556 stop:720 length:165 start_codon:yes stop_codon:yes gene_type:complete